MGIIDIEKIAKDAYIREQNTMLGEFLGWKLEVLNPNEEYDEYNEKLWEFHKYENGKIVDMNGGGDNWSWEEGMALPFDWDWHWLMDVVEKIEETAYVLIKNNGCDISCKDDPEAYLNPTSYGTSKKEGIWLAVVSFVTWYNKNKK